MFSKNKAPRIKSKTIVVSTKSLFGASPYDKAIEKYGSAGWQLVGKTEALGKPDSYVLQFQYSMSPEEIAAEDKFNLYRNIGMGILAVIGFGIVSFSCNQFMDYSYQRATETHAAKFTEVVLAVSEQAAATQTASQWTAVPTDTPSATPSETPIPLPTDTPMITPSATITNTPLAATQSPGQILTTQIATLDGVEHVLLASVLYDRAGLPLVSLELVVESGRNTQSMAETSLQASTEALGIAEYAFFSVILDDGSATDYVFDFRSSTWNITPLRQVTPQGGANNQARSATATLTPAPARTFYVTGDYARIRECASTDCREVNQLPRGSSIQVVGEVQGDEANNSTLWYVLSDGNYVHSSTVSQTPPVQAQQSGGGSTSSGGGGFATNVPTAAGVPCSCAGDTLNCNTASFSSMAAAQACYDYCMSQGAGDIHGLDGNGDGEICESGL